MAECTIQLSIDEFLKSYKTLLCKYNKYLDAEEVSLDDINKIKDQIRELLEYYKDILLLEAYQDIEELDTLIAGINEKLANGDFVGVQGEPFLYEDFTPQQLEALKVKGDKGDSFIYDDFTPEQLANLKAYQNISQDGDNVVLKDGLNLSGKINNRVPKTIYSPYKNTYVHIIGFSYSQISRIVHIGRIAKAYWGRGNYIIEVFDNHYDNSRYAKFLINGQTSTMHNKVLSLMPIFNYGIPDITFGDRVDSSVTGYQDLFIEVPAYREFTIRVTTIGTLHVHNIDDVKDGNAYYLNNATEVL
jgi:hypothetical protein